MGVEVAYGLAKLGVELVDSSLSFAEGRIALTSVLGGMVSGAIGIGLVVIEGVGWE